MPILIALFCGILFGAGLCVSGMTNPQKVLNFLDIAAIPAGRWDPTLLLVFLGALPVMFAVYRLRLPAGKPWFTETFSIPTRDDIDRKLVVGSSLFGIGWGLVGLCPGPAIAALGIMSRPVLGPIALFVSAMMLGIWIANASGLTATRSDQVAV